MLTGTDVKTKLCR